MTLLGQAVDCAKRDSVTVSSSARSFASFLSRHNWPLSVSGPFWVIYPRITDGDSHRAKRKKTVFTWSNDRVRLRPNSTFPITSAQLRQLSGKTIFLQLISNEIKSSAFATQVNLSFIICIMFSSDIFHIHGRIPKAC